MAALVSKYFTDASYYDGKTAQAHAVKLFMTPGRMHWKMSDNNEVVWPFNELRLFQDAELGQDMIIGSNTHGDARLVIRDKTAQRRLHRFFDRRRKGIRSLATFARIEHSWKIVALTVAIFAAFYTFWPLITPAIARIVPYQWEKSIGDSVVADLGGDDGFCKTASGQEALETLQRNLMRAIPHAPPMRLYVLPLDEINAAAAPGGVLILFDGLLQKAESLDEVAGIVGHEMGHVLEHHAVNHALRSIGFSAFLYLTLGGDLSSGMIARTANSAIENNYSRDEERQADRWGLHLAREGGYDPQALADFFARDRKENGDFSTITRFFSSHPDSAERLAMIREQPNSFAKKRQTGAQLAALKHMCDAHKKSDPKGR